MQKKMEMESFHVCLCCIVVFSTLLITDGAYVSFQASATTNEAELGPTTVSNSSSSSSSPPNDTSEIAPFTTIVISSSNNSNTNNTSDSIPQAVSQDGNNSNSNNTSTNTEFNNLQRGEYKVDNNGIHYYNIKNCSLVPGSSGIGNLSECEDAERQMRD